MRTWIEEENYKKVGYMVITKDTNQFYDTLQNMYLDFKEDFTNNCHLKVYQIFVNDSNPNQINEILEKIVAIKDVETLQFWCKILKCE